MLTAGERLDHAIKLRLGSVRKFERELQAAAPKLRGTTRTTIGRYVEGKTDPPAGFLKAASKVLGVREAWLASGAGEMTEEDERRAADSRAHAQRSAPDATDEKVRARTEMFREVLPNFDEHSHGITSMWWAWSKIDSVREMLDGDPVTQGPYESRPPSVDARIARCVEATLNAFDLEPQDIRDNVHGQSFVMHLCSALVSMQLAVADTYELGGYIIRLRTSEKGADSDDSDDAHDVPGAPPPQGGPPPRVGREARSEGRGRE